jgi:hypothetical protein
VSRDHGHEGGDRRDHHTLQVESSQEIAALTASLGADPKLSLIRFNQ